MIPGLGPNYRRTRYGWEPVNQSFAVTPRPDPLTQFQKDFIRLVGETIELGADPRRALKYWGWIVEIALEKGL